MYVANQRKALLHKKWNTDPAFIVMVENISSAHKCENIT